MYWGQGFGCYWGDPETFQIIDSVKDLITGAVMNFHPIPDYPQYFKYVIDRRDQGAPFYVLDTITTPFQIVGEYVGPSPHIVSVLGQGPWSDSSWDGTEGQLIFGAARSDRILSVIKAQPDYFSIETSGLTQFSAWSGAGVSRFSNCQPNVNRPTWGEIDLTMTTLAGLHTVTGSCKGSSVCQGSRTGNGAITLSALNGSGVSFSATLAYTSDIATGGALIVTAFPAAYYIYFKLGADWVANDFPAGVSYSVSGAAWAANVATLTIGAHLITVGTTLLVSGIKPKIFNGTVVVTAITGTTVSFALTTNPGAYVSGGSVVRMPTASINDDGRSTYYDYDSGPLANGTWHIVIHQVSAETEESSGTTNTTLALVSVPEPPTDLLLNNPTGDVIQWQASTTALATYNGYDSGSTGVIPASVTFTHVAGVGTLTKSLSALGGFTGTRYVMIRSLLAGIESGNSVALEITYVAGVALLVRPNSPALGAHITANGLTLTAKFSLDTRGQSVAPTSIQLFAQPVGTPMDYTTEIGHTLISSLTEVALRYYGTVSGAVLADGEYMYAVRTNSANGQSLNTDTYGPIRLTTALPLDPVITIEGGV